MTEICYLHLLTLHKQICQLSGCGWSRVCPPSGPSGSGAAGLVESMQIDHNEPKVHVNKLGDRLSQTALTYNDFRHQYLDSTSEESFGII